MYTRYCLEVRRKDEAVTFKLIHVARRCAGFTGSG